MVVSTMIEAESSLGERGGNTGEKSREAEDRNIQNINIKEGYSYTYIQTFSGSNTMLGAREIFNG